MCVAPGNDSSIAACRNVTAQLQVHSLQQLDLRHTDEVQICGGKPGDDDLTLAIPKVHQFISSWNSRWQNYICIQVPVDVSCGYSISMCNVSNTCWLQMYYQHHAAL